MEQITVIALALIATSAWADTFRLHYSIRGSGREITLQAESSSEARRTVMDLYSKAVVTGVHRVKYRSCEQRETEPAEIAGFDFLSNPASY